MRRAWAAMVLVPGTAWAAPGCAEQVAVDSLALRLEAAEIDYANLAPDEFLDNVQRSGSELECMIEPIPPQLAARYHRVHGLAAFTEGHLQDSAAAFAAARSVEPEGRFSTDVVPEGHTVNTEYERIDLATGGFAELPPRASGQVLIDGSAAERRPQDWPAIVQLVSDDGRVETTRYLAPGDAMPAYEVYEPPRKHGVPILIGGGVAVVGGAILHGLAVSASNDYFSDEGQTGASLDSARSRANGFEAAALATGGVGLGLCGAAFVVGF